MLTTTVFIWFITGMVLGALLLALSRSIRIKKIKMAWPDWLMGITGLLLLLFTVQNVLAFFSDELEPTAAWMFALIVGIPAIVLLGLATISVRRRSKLIS